MTGRELSNSGTDLGRMAAQGKQKDLFPFLWEDDNSGA